MSIFQRYFLTQIVKAVAFILVAFLALFAFFDLIGELPLLGKGAYKFVHMFVYVILSFPGYIYELMPFAVLIGTIYAMARFAANSEFTIMRVSSMSTRDACKMLIKVGVIFLVFTYIVGEGIMPYTTRLAVDYRNDKLGRGIGHRLKTGVWAKDSLYSPVDGKKTGNRFMNIKLINQDKSVNHIRLYEFNNNHELLKAISATKGVYLGDKEWLLTGIKETHIHKANREKEHRFPGTAPKVTTHKKDSMTITSDVTPEILAVMTFDPARMSLYELVVYNWHLQENKQDAQAYQIAFWKKIIYPFSVFVMMGLSLPFAYLHFRSGGIALKIFIGIMIGVAFVLFNNLFAHMGLIHHWWPFFTACTPSALFLAAAIYAVRWVERH